MSGTKAWEVKLYGAISDLHKIGGYFAISVITVGRLDVTLKTGASFLVEILKVAHFSPLKTS